MLWLTAAKEALRQPRIYWVALVIGTVINLYGQIIVPYTRGTENVWGSFLGEIEQYPLISACSLAIAYLFPLLVSVFQTVAMRYDLEKEKGSP